MYECGRAAVAFRIWENVGREHIRKSKQVLTDDTKTTEILKLSIPVGQTYVNTQYRIEFEEKINCKICKLLQKVSQKIN